MEYAGYIPFWDKLNRDQQKMIGEVIRFVFEREPAWLLDVFHGVKVITDGAGYQRMSVDMDALERKVLQLRTQRMPGRCG
jgi:hypothetical protein